VSIKGETSRFTMPARLSTCALLAAAALALAPAAQATPATPTLSFSEPAVVSAADNTIIDIRVIAGDDGSVTVLWTRGGPWTEASGWTRPLMASTRLAGETSWSTHELSGPVYTTLRELAGGSAADGTVTVTWEQGGSGPGDVYSATRTAGTTSWSAPVRISTPDATRGNGSAAMVRADGSAVVAWMTYSPGKSVLYATRNTGAGAEWSTPKTLEVGATNDYFNPAAMAEDGGGNISLLYVRDDSAMSASIVRSATLTAGSTTFSAPQDAATEPAGKVGDLTALALPGGDLAAAWQRPDEHMGPPTVMAVRRTGGVWQAPSQLSADAVEGRPPRLAADRLGNVTALWTATSGGDPYDSSGYRVSAATAVPGGRWQAPFYPSGTGRPSAHGQMLGVRGWVVGLWVAPGSSPDWTPEYTIANNFTESFSAAAAFGSAITLSSNNPPAYAANLAGMIAAAWQGPDYAIRVSTAAAGQLPDLNRKPPVAEPTPTPPVDRPADPPPPLIDDPPIPTPRAPQLRLQGRRVVVNVRVTLRRGARCAGAVSAASRIGAAGRRTTHGKGLRLRTVNRDGRQVCVITGSLMLRKAPAAGQALRVAFRSANLRLGARIVTHGG